MSKKCFFTSFLLFLSFCFLLSIVCTAQPTETMTTETIIGTTDIVTTEPSEPSQSADSSLSFDNPSVWIVFILALLVGLFLAQALSFWKW